MRIAILGGTGVVGTPLLAQTLAAGHHVTLLARTPAAVPAHDRLAVVEGDALDQDAVTKTIIGADAVLSTLGGFGDSEAIRLGTQHVVEAMRRHEVARLVVLQGFHLELPGDPGGLGRTLVGIYLRLSDRRLPTDSQAMAELLLGVHDVDWTLVRIPRVVAGGPTGHTKLGIQRLGPVQKVTAGDAAATMLAVLDDPDCVHRAPMVQSVRA